VKLKDWQVFDLLTVGFVAIHAYLGNFNTALLPMIQFYLISWALSTPLIWVIYYMKIGVVEFGENVRGEKFFYVIGGVAGLIVIAKMFVSAYAPSSLYVPTMSLSLGSVSVTLLNDLLFSLALVAPAEEKLKLVSHIGLGDLLEHHKRAKWLADVAPIVAWGLWHLYMSYVGVGAAWMALSAVVSGFVIYFLSYSKKIGLKSIFVAVLVHAGYNCYVILKVAGVIPSFLP